MIAITTNNSISVKPHRDPDAQAGGDAKAHFTRQSPSGQGGVATERRGQGPLGRGGGRPGSHAPSRGRPTSLTWTEGAV
jgi:hypothetical protein